MRPELGARRLYRVLPAVVGLFACTVFSAPTRLDFYDKSNNHLLYVDFLYDASGKLSGRTVYAADGTFLRDVAMNKGADGKRVSEVSTNFNSPNDQFGGGDTLFVTGYEYAGETTSFTIHDQFKLDWLGEKVSYAPAVSNPHLYDLVYPSDGSLAASILYDIDDAGNPVKVDVYDAKRSLEYYGIFSDKTGVRQGGIRYAARPQVKIRTRGQAGIDVQLNISQAGQVRGELMTLSGRVAGVLLDEMVPKGNFLRSFRSGEQICVANGVYLFVVKIDGTVVSTGKYVHQVTRGGSR